MEETIKRLIKILFIFIIITIGLLIIINATTNNNNNFQYENKEEFNNIYMIDIRMIMLLVYVVCSIIIFVVSFIINKRIKSVKYRRETNDLVSPIIAEAIIDGKIGLKELIMTTIIELNIRGNIKIIDNDTIELISFENLEDYEKSILELIFNKKIIKFKEINDIFIKSNKKTIEFTQKMNKIKKQLFDKLYSSNLFSKTLTVVNKIITLFSIWNIINLIPLLFEDSITMGQVFSSIGILITIYFINSNVNKNTMQEEMIKNIRIRKGSNVTIIIWISIVLLVKSLIQMFRYNIVYVIVVFIACGINIYTIYKSKSSVLTKNGKKELIKLLELKKFIKGYSLMEKRDLESVVIWDKYLAYAAAFSIPNKVVNTIYENWYNLNLNLQVVNKILK